MGLTQRLAKTPLFSSREWQHWQPLCDASPYAIENCYDYQGLWSWDMPYSAERSTTLSQCFQVRPHIPWRLGDRRFVLIMRLMVVIILFVFTSFLDGVLLVADPSINSFVQNAAWFWHRSIRTDSQYMRVEGEKIGFLFTHVDWLDTLHHWRSKFPAGHVDVSRQFHLSRLSLFKRFVSPSSLALLWRSGL